MHGGLGIALSQARCSGQKSPLQLSPSLPTVRRAWLYLLAALTWPWHTCQAILGW